ncbi:hypothetical protein BS78_06G007200 [Paspalum vaginatum]|nr:hypothetical protein BS78_06G007200 [Paspalum vaginatum]
MLWAAVTEKFNIPEEVKQKVEHWTLKKMAKQFKNYNKVLWDAFKKDGTEPKFETYPKLKGHWDAFVRHRQSEEAKAISAQNSASASSKKYHQNLGPTGYKGSEEKWEKMEADLVQKGITPATHNWSYRLKRWYYAHQGTLAEDGSLIYKDEKAKELTEKVMEVVEKTARGDFIPNRENDELSFILGNPEHPGRIRGFGNKTWKDGFVADAESYKSRHRSKAIQEARVQSLENELAKTKASIPSEVARQLAAAIEAIWSQGLLPPAADVLSPERSGLTRAHGSSCASTELPDEQYPVDEIQQRTRCELHVQAMNLTTPIACGMVSPPVPGQKLHGQEVPEGFTILSVDEVFERYKDLELTFPCRDGGSRLEQALHGFILWKKPLIVIVGEPKAMTAAVPPSLAGSPHGRPTPDPTSH